MICLPPLPEDWWISERRADLARQQRAFRLRRWVRAALTSPCARYAAGMAITLAAAWFLLELRP